MLCLLGTSRHGVPWLEEADVLRHVTRPADALEGPATERLHHVSGSLIPRLLTESS